MHAHRRGPRFIREWVWLALATVGALPWLSVRLLLLAHAPLPFPLLDHPAMVAGLAGLAILAAAFLLSWAAETAQLDMSPSLALALLALIAILPEYSVDMYFAWQAGRMPDSLYAHYAIANMTGANRLLIGVAWSLVVAIFWLRTRGSGILIDPARRLEITFLVMATLYSFSIPLRHHISPFDAGIFIGLFVWYVLLAMRAERVDPDLVGPPVMMAALPRGQRHLLTGGMFVYAALAILAAAEPFAESLVAMGRFLGVDPFFLVQWVAPLASETPEFILASLFAFRGHPSLAIGTLISSKINQWTLLVGLIPGIYSLARGQLAPFPMDAVQTHELLLTSAQSLFAAALLADLRLSLGEAAALAGLFLAQMITQMLVPESLLLRTAFSIVYLVLAVILVLMSRRRYETLSHLLAPLWRARRE